MIRAGSDQGMKPSSATRLATEVTFHAHHEHFVLKNTTFGAPAIIQLHQILRLPRKVKLIIDPLRT